jgi:biotin carboxyl carrier protein
VNSATRIFEVEIIDAETRYLNSRRNSNAFEGDNSISSPMPGKVVKIQVKEGDIVEFGQTVIIVSAMKMESEFKAAKAGKVKAVYVKEGDLVEGNKVMVIIE